MSEQPKTPVVTPDPIPASVPEDLIPAWLWFKENGMQWLIVIALAVLLAAGVAVFRRHQTDKAAKASEQLLTQPAIETLKKAVADYGNTPAGIGAKLKLAKAYYDAGSYTEALAQYDAFIKDHASYPFADVARVGRGFALLGLNRLDEANTAFCSFRQKNPGHYLTQQTILGESACLVMQGKKDAAKSLLQELRVANRDTYWEAAAKRMEGAIDRYQTTRLTAPRSLLEQASAIAPIPAPVIPAPVISTATGTPIFVVPTP